MHGSTVMKYYILKIGHGIHRYKILYFESDAFFFVLIYLIAQYTFMDHLKLLFFCMYVHTVFIY